MDQLLTIPDQQGPIRATIATPDPDCRYALMLHGGPGGTQDGPDNLFIQLSSLLAQRGWGTLRFDFRRADVSGGLSVCSLRTDYAIVHSWMRQNLSAPHVIIGESLGATVAIMSMSYTQERGVFLWPAIDLCDTAFRPLFDRAHLKSADIHGSTTVDGVTYSKGFLDDCLTLDVLPKLRSMESSYCIVHGTEDREVPSVQSEQLAAELGEKATLHLISGADHGVTTMPERNEVLQVVTDWITSE